MKYNQLTLAEETHQSTSRVLDFAVSADHRAKILQSEMIKKNVEYKGDDDTNYN